MKENEKKVSDIRQMKDREKSEMEKKAEIKIRELQTHYERIMESKIKEIEENTQFHIEKIKDEESNLRKYIEQYENNYMPKIDHEELVTQRDELILSLKKKMEEF